MFHTARSRALAMKIPAALLRRLHWINLPTAALLALLQRTPLLRVLATAGEGVFRAPAASLLKSAFATAASLGAVHSLAGATALSVSSTTNPPNTATAGTAKTIVFTVTGALVPAASWTVGASSGSTVPPGMTYTAFGSTSPGVTSGLINNTSTIQLSGTPSAPGSFTLRLQAWEKTGGTGDSITYTYLITVAAAPNTAPVFTTQPATQTAPGGGAAVFFVVAAGSPAPTYQWSKNSVAIAGQTGSSLTLSGLTTNDAGSYTCVATNTIGSATSNAATLTITGGATGPVITTQPSSVTAPLGGSAAFTVTATGVSSYQWRKNGVAIPGATGSTLTFNPLSASDGASYDVVLTNSAGTTTSVTVALLISTGLTSRLSNVSVRTTLTANQILTVGLTMQGGAKPVLIRAAGPALGALGVPGTMADPKLSVFNGSTLEASNDNWAGNSTVSAAITAVGAFPFASAASLDAALVSNINGGRTVQVSGPAAGNLIVEAYDAGAGNSPRLTNLSALNFVGTGADVLIAGFTIDGTGTKNVLIRAVGPSLTPLGVTGVLADPKLDLFNSAQAKIASNDNWPDSLATVFSGIGAFPLTSGGKDAALVINLPPGGYTVQVSGADGGTGVAIVEVYELP